MNVVCLSVCLLPMVRYGTKFKLYIYLVLLENQKVIHSFANIPSSHKLSGDITGIVLDLYVGRIYVASPGQINLHSGFDGRTGVLDYSYEHVNTSEEPLGM